jgi:hypothetical protein
MIDKTKILRRMFMQSTTKFHLASLCTVLAVSFSMQMANADDSLPAVREVTVGVSDVYIPGGFSSETDSFVVANGIFPNGCYRWKGAEVKHVDALNHEIQSKALVSQGMCLMVLVPFTKEIRLGRLSTGQHKLKFINGDGTYLEKSLTVE